MASEDVSRGAARAAAAAEPEPPTGARPRWRGALSSLENPQFRWLYISNLAFFMAMGSQQIVRAWLAWTLTGSELALGLVMVVVAIGMLVLGPIGGVIADRVRCNSIR